MLTFDTIREVGGVEARAKAYAGCLSRLGHKVLLFDASRGGKKGTEERHGATIHSIPASPLYLISNLLTILRATISHQIHSIFILSGVDSLLGLLLLAYARARRMGCGVFMYGKDVLEAKRSFFSSCILICGLLFANKVGVNSHATSQLLWSFASRKLSILYPGVDPTIAEQYPKVVGDSKKVLFVGRLVKRKGCDDLIKAFALMLKEVPDAELEIVGDGPEKLSLRRLAREYGVEDRVHFFGPFTDKPLHERYATCTVFCMPSRTLKYDVEGFGIVFLEAALFGKPCIGTWSGGIPEAIVHGVTGILVPEGDIDALSRALKQMLKDSELARGLGRRGRERVLRDFTWEKATQRLIDMLRDP